ncbi:MAG: DUF6090 family protein [Flavobacteriaceae bacterium]|nr:DUF6090 family protein [Flavobacteriaceae bacterium]
MLKFFRSIRQDLLSEGKTTKYLKYAIGEIILVVVGIVIALQLDGWNANRLDGREEQMLLTQLKTEFIQNKTQLLTKIGKREDAMNSCFEILKIVDNPQLEKDPNQIDSLFATILPNYTFDPTTGIINQLLHGGKLSLIRNDSLRFHLSNWEGIVDQATEEEKIYMLFNMNDLRPTLYELYPFRNIMVKSGSSGSLREILLKEGNENRFELGKSKLPMDLDKLFSSTEFEGKISSTINWLSVSNIQAQGFIDYSDTVLKLIDEALEE